MERGLKLRSVSSGVPWKMPQSIRRRLPAASTRYLEPVTVPAAPRKVSLGIGVSLYRRDGRSQCVGIQKVLKRKYRRERRKKKAEEIYRRGTEGAEMEIDNERLHLAEMGRS